MDYQELLRAFVLMPKATRERLIRLAKQTSFVTRRDVTDCVVHLLDMKSKSDSDRYHVTEAYPIKSRG